MLTSEHNSQPCGVLASFPCLILPLPHLHLASAPASSSHCLILPPPAQLASAGALPASTPCKASQSLKGPAQPAAIQQGEDKRGVHNPAGRNPLLADDDYDDLIPGVKGICMGLLTIQLQLLAEHCPCLSFNLAIGSLQLPTGSFQLPAGRICCICAGLR